MEKGCSTSVMSSSLPIQILCVDGGGVLCTGIPENMLDVLATRYPDADMQLQIRNLHRTNYGAWNKIKANPNFTEGEYIAELMQGVHLNESIDDIALLIRQELKVHGRVLEILEQVKQQGITLGIISNHCTVWFDYLISQYNLYAVFPRDLIVVSQTVGCAKPSTQIWELFYERAKLKFPTIQREQILFVDDKKVNVTAACQYGFKGFEYNFEKQAVTEFVNMLKSNGLL